MTFLDLPSCAKVVMTLRKGRSIITASLPHVFTRGFFYLIHTWFQTRLFKVVQKLRILSLLLDKFTYCWAWEFSSTDIFWLLSFSVIYLFFGGGGRGWGHTYIALSGKYLPFPPPPPQVRPGFAFRSKTAQDILVKYLYLPKTLNRSLSRLTTFIWRKILFSI